MDNKDILIDKITTNRVEKNENLFKGLAIATFILAILKIVIKPDILTGNGSIIDYLISLLPIYFYYNYRSKTSKHKGQFIEWRENILEFKSKDSHEKIDLEKITDISIHLDLITITLSDRTTKILNIEDYVEYDDRLRIKSNFERMQHSISRKHPLLS